METMARMLPSANFEHIWGGVSQFVSSGPSAESTLASLLHVVATPTAEVGRWSPDEAKASRNPDVCAVRAGAFEWNFKTMFLLTLSGNRPKVGPRGQNECRAGYHGVALGENCAVGPRRISLWHSQAASAQSFEVLEFQIFLRSQRREHVGDSNRRLACPSGDTRRSHYIEHHKSPGITTGTSGEMAESTERVREHDHSVLFSTCERHPYTRAMLVFCSAPLYFHRTLSMIRGGVRHRPKTGRNMSWTTPPHEDMRRDTAGVLVNWPGPFFNVTPNISSPRAHGDRVEVRGRAH